MQFALHFHTFSTVHELQIELVTPVKCVECWWSSQFTNCPSASRLASCCLLWRCHRSALRQHQYPVTTRQASGFFCDDFRGFTHLHRCHSRISLRKSSRKSSWSRLKLSWCKNYAVVPSSLNNQSRNHRQLSWTASVSSIAQKTCFKRFLKLRQS